MPTQEWKGTVNNVVINSTTIGPFTKDAAGQVTNPTQPAFLSFSSATTDVTGDGTVYTVAFDTEIFDQNSDFNGSTTFTAPVTGKYSLGVSLTVKGLAAGNTRGQLNIVVAGTSAKTYAIWDGNIGAILHDAEYATISGTVPILAMTATDTATVTFTVSGGTEIVDITNLSFFSGMLLF